jgi:hypothetical protein
MTGIGTQTARIEVAHEHSAEEEDDQAQARPGSRLGQWPAAGSGRRPGNGWDRGGWRDAGGELGQLSVGPRGKRPGRPRIKFVYGEPAIRERVFQCLDRLLAVSVSSPEPATVRAGLQQDARSVQARFLAQTQIIQSGTVRAMIEVELTSAHSNKAAATPAGSRPSPAPDQWPPAATARPPRPRRPVQDAPASQAPRARQAESTSHPRCTVPRSLRTPPATQASCRPAWRGRTPGSTSHSPARGRSAAGRDPHLVTRPDAGTSGSAQRRQRGHTPARPQAHRARRAAAAPHQPGWHDRTT